MPSSVPNHMPAWAPTRQERVRDYARVREYDQQQAFYRTAAWLKLRVLQLNTHPYCDNHLSNGEHVPATVVHHHEPIRTHPHRALDMSNLRSLCKPCHDAITARERVHEES